MPIVLILRERNPLFGDFGCQELECLLELFFIYGQLLFYSLPYLVLLFFGLTLFFPIESPLTLFAS